MGAVGLGREMLTVQCIYITPRRCRAGVPLSGTRIHAAMRYGAAAGVTTKTRLGELPCFALLVLTTVPQRSMWSTVVLYEIRPHPVEGSQSWRRLGGGERGWLGAPCTVRWSEHKHDGWLYYLPHLIMACCPATRRSASIPTHTGLAPRWDGRITGWYGSDVAYEPT